MRHGRYLPPQPTQGGTLDNKVVQTLARAFVQLGWRAVRFNFRGIGQTEGAWDEGRARSTMPCGDRADFRQAGEPLLLGGFFSGLRGHPCGRSSWPSPQRLVLVGPPPAFRHHHGAGDTLVIHGEQDDVVPFASVLDWAWPQSLPVVVVPGVGHFFHGQLPLLKNLVRLVVSAFDPSIP